MVVKTTRSGCFSPTATPHFEPFLQIHGIFVRTDAPVLWTPTRLVEKTEIVYSANQKRDRIV